MTRLHMPDEQNLTSEQGVAISEVVSGQRGKVPAPMIAWLRNPELARRAQSLGELLRFETSLSPRQIELAILVCGRHWTSHHEWTAHKKIALSAGVDATTIGEIAAGRKPSFEQPLEEIVYQVAATILSTGKVPNALYQQGLAALGEKGMVELIALLGYYSLVALTLNAFEIGLPENFAVELELPDHQ